MSWFSPLSSEPPARFTANQSEAAGWALSRAIKPGLSLLLGSAGTGKSTVCNAIAHTYAGRVHIERATPNTSLNDAVNHVRTNLGTPESGDLVILEDYFDGVSPIYPTELRILAEPTNLGRGHLLVTARDTPHLGSRYDNQNLQFPQLGEMQANPVSSSSSLGRQLTSNKRCSRSLRLTGLTCCASYSAMSQHHGNSCKMPPATSTATPDPSVQTNDPTSSSSPMRTGGSTSNQPHQ